MAAGRSRKRVSSKLNAKTSNPGSADLQDAKAQDGRTFSELLADRLAPLATQEGLLGTSGYSSLGAVVGATQPQTMASLRQRRGMSCARASSWRS